MKSHAHEATMKSRGRTVRKIGEEEAARTDLDSDTPPSNYFVSYTVSGTAGFVVTADTPEEAIQKADNVSWYEATLDLRWEVQEVMLNGKVVEIDHLKLAEVVVEDNGSVSEPTPKFDTASLCRATGMMPPRRRRYWGEE